MLSIIISSYQPEYFAALEKNIAETCGIPCEIIKIDNPGIMGICEAYNKGAAKAKFDNLLFLHEDVIFETKNWGNILVEYLSNKNTGIIGIGGCRYIPKCPFAWWDYSKNSFYHIDQCDANKKLLRRYNLYKDTRVTALDGVFLACRKNVYKEFKFDENLKGFHGYDLNFSTRIAEKYDNYISHKILIKHFSVGNPNVDWLMALIENRMTFKAPSFQKTDKKLEALYFKQFLEYLKRFNIPMRKALPFLNPHYIGWKESYNFLLKFVRNKI